MPKIAGSLQDPRKIRARLRSYERKLQKEKKEHGFYRDGATALYPITLTK